MGNGSTEVNDKRVYGWFVGVVSNWFVVLVAKTKCVTVFRSSNAQSRGGLLQFCEVLGLLAFVYPYNSPRLPEHYRRDQASPGYQSLDSATTIHHRQQVAITTLII